MTQLLVTSVDIQLAEVRTAGGTLEWNQLAPAGAADAAITTTIASVAPMVPMILRIVFSSFSGCYRYPAAGGAFSVAFQRRIRSERPIRIGSGCSEPLSR
jgi:hypothetical protein